MGLVSAAATFNDLEVSPLADATRHFVIPVLFRPISDSSRMGNIDLSPSALTVLDCPISAWWPGRSHTG